MEREPPMKNSIDKEEICVHVVLPQNENDSLPEQDNRNLFDIAPFRQRFFRYSMYGQSEVVKSSSFVYASHHSSQLSWLEIKKLSVALVGNNEIPNLGLFAPTVREIYFMGHITYPTTTFSILPQLACLESVVFNIGLGGFINEFHETTEEFDAPTPEIPSVTSLEIKLNHQLYQTRSEEIKNIFGNIVKSIIKHSSDSFPNLTNIIIDLPNTPDFYRSVLLLVQGSENLRETFEIIQNDDRDMMTNIEYLEMISRLKPSGNRFSVRTVFLLTPVHIFQILLSTIF